MDSTADPALIRYRPRGEVVAFFDDDDQNWVVMQDDGERIHLDIMPDYEFEARYEPIPTEEKQ